MIKGRLHTVGWVGWQVSCGEMSRDGANEDDDAKPLTPSPRCLGAVPLPPSVGPGG